MYHCRVDLAWVRFTVSVAAVTSPTSAAPATACGPTGRRSRPPEMSRVPVVSPSCGSLGRAGRQRGAPAPPPSA